MTDQNEQANEDTTERDAEIMRSHQIVGDALDKAFSEISKKEVLTDVLLSMLLFRAATIARQEDLKSNFLRAVGHATRLVMGAEEAEAPNDKPDFDNRCETLIDGIKITARINASANKIDSFVVPLLLIESAVQVAAEDGGRAGCLELVESMKRIVERHEARAAEHVTKH